MVTTTYVVGGLPRSGTSMLMRALISAGLEAFYEEEKEQNLARQWQKLTDSGYNPNPYGVFEPGKYKTLPEFPFMIKGKLVKLMGRIPSEPRFAYCDPMRIAFILRDREAIKKSSIKALGREPVWTSETNFRNLIRARLSEFSACDFIKSVTEIKYEDIINPETRLSQFEALVNDGWNIDPNAAADTVDDNLCRFNK